MGGHMQCGGGRGIEMGSAFNIFICHMQVVDGGVKSGR